MDGHMSISRIMQTVIIRLPYLLILSICSENGFTVCYIYKKHPISGPAVPKWGCLRLLFVLGISVAMTIFSGIAIFAIFCISAIAVVIAVFALVHVDAVYQHAETG